MPTLTFVREDRDNCRVYYRDDTGWLFCVQDDSAFSNKKVAFYSCSRDGEPSYPVPMPPVEHFDRFIDPTRS